MKKHFYWECLCYVPFYNGNRDSFSKAEIKSIMRKVADWQIANPHPALNMTI